MKSLRFAPIWLALMLALAIVGLASASTGAPATGNTWTVTQSPNPGGWGNIISGMSALTERDVWAVGVQATFTSNDPLAMHWNGTSWSSVAVPTPVPDCEDGNIQWAGNSLNDVDGAATNDVWAVGGDCYEIHPLLEHWNGSAWTIIAGAQPPGGGYLDDVTALSPTNVWAVGSQGLSGSRTLVMHYDGKSWIVVPSPNQSTAANADNDLRGAAAVGPNDVWAVGMYQNEQTAIHQHRTLVEHWNGASWTIAPSPSPGHSSELNAAAAPAKSLGSVGRPQTFAAGLFSLYDINIYDGTYTLPQTLVMTTR